MKPEVRVQYNIIQILSVLASIIALFFIWMGFSEYIKVSVHRQTSGYASGYVNENPWYYKNSSTYSNYNLFSCVPFLIGLGITIIGLIKSKTRFSILGITVIIILVIANQISANIQS